MTTSRETTAGTKLRHPDLAHISIQGTHSLLRTCLVQVDRLFISQSQKLPVGAQYRVDLPADIRAPSQITLDLTCLGIPDTSVDDQVCVIPAESHGMRPPERTQAQACLGIPDPYASSGAWTFVVEFDTIGRQHLAVRTADDATPNGAGEQGTRRADVRQLRSCLPPTRDRPEECDSRRGFARLFSAPGVLSSRLLEPLVPVAEQVLAVRGQASRFLLLRSAGGPPRDFGALQPRPASS